MSKEQKAIDDLMDYVEHKEECLFSQWRQGRPTKDGGYENLYGYGSNEKWYQRGEKPECTCGLNDVIASLNARPKIDVGEIEEIILNVPLTTYEILTRDDTGISYLSGSYAPNKIAKAIAEYINK